MPMGMAFFFVPFFALYFLAQSVFSEPIQIQINSDDGKMIPLNVEKEATVKSLKMEIQEQEGILPEQQLLDLEGHKNGKIIFTRLEDDDTLEKHNIQNGNVIELFVKRPRKPKKNKIPRIQINFELQKDFLPTRFSLRAKPTETIGELKKKIVLELKRQMENLEFEVHNELQHDAVGFLSDAKKTIADYGVKNGDTVHVRDESQAPPTMPRNYAGPSAIINGVEIYN